MRRPMLFRSDAIGDERWPRQKIGDGWIRSRPIGDFGNPLTRFTLAFQVLIGKYDALAWYDPFPHNSGSARNPSGEI